MNVFDLFATLKLDTSEYEKGLDSAEKKAGDWKTALGDAGKAVAGVTTVVGGLAAAGFGLASNTANQADEIDKMSQKLGLSAKSYQEWDYVMNLAGTSMSNMSTGMKTLTNKIDDAKNGSESAQKMFAQLGISMDDLNSMSREDIFAATIKGFQGMADSTERAALANDLYGKSGQELTPLFNQTAEETDKLIQQINDLGGVMSDDAVKAGAQFNDSLATMKASFDGAKNSIASQFLPTFTSLMDNVSTFVGEGGLQKMIDLFNALLPVVGAITAGFIAYKSAVAISAVIDAVTKATEGMSIAQAALNAVMNANPFVLVATVIAGLVAALVVLWNTNEGFRTSVLNAWSTITTTISNAVNSIRNFFTVTIPNAVQNAISALKELPKNALTWGRDLMDNFISGITDKIQALKDKVSSVAQTVKDFLGFSEPKEGPLSNFHTYAPDMMDLFMKGISDNEGRLRNQIAKTFDFGTVGNIGYEPSAYTSNSAIQGENGAGNTYNFTINVYDRNQSADELAREIMVEAKYGLMRGVAIG